MVGSTSADPPHPSKCSPLKKKEVKKRKQNLKQTQRPQREGKQRKAESSHVTYIGNRRHPLSTDWLNILWRCDDERILPLHKHQLERTYINQHKKTERKTKTHAWAQKYEHGNTKGKVSLSYRETSGYSLKCFGKRHILLCFI